MRWFAYGALAVVLWGCSSSDSTETDPGDGRYHPAPNGKHTTEQSACSTLSAAQTDRRQDIGCAGTTRACPDLLRAEFGTDCLEYDEGSVEGCVDYYGKAKDCDALADAIDMCVVTSYPGTEPKGCPTK